MPGVEKKKKNGGTKEWSIGEEISLEIEGRRDGMENLKQRRIISEKEEGKWRKRRMKCKEN